VSLLSVNWNPTKKDLNGFRLVALGILPVMAVVLYAVKHVSLPWCLAVAGGGVLIWGSGFVSLTVTRWIFVGLMAVTLPIGLVVSFVVMALIFFGLLTPVGLIFRLMGRDILNRRFDPTASTYWQPHTQVLDSERYFQQF
jgi:hypothetical protein